MKKILEKNEQFKLVNEHNRCTFVGKKLGTNLFDTEIRFCGANFKKIDEMIKISKDYQYKFDKFCTAIENGESYSELQVSLDKNSITSANLEKENNKLQDLLEERERKTKFQIEELLKSIENLTKENEILKKHQNEDSKIEKGTKRKADNQPIPDGNGNSTKKRRIE